MNQALTTHDTLPSGLAPCGVFTRGPANDVSLHMFDVEDDLQINENYYLKLSPSLPYDEEQLALDALRQAEIAKKEGAKVMVETMMQLVRNILVRNKLIL